MDNNTRVKICILTVNELSERLIAEINLKNVLEKPFPECDFAIAEIKNENESLEAIAETSTGWFGIKSVETGFDSNNLNLIVDYYGGGCANLIEIFNGTEYIKDSVVLDISSAIQKSFDFYGETVDSETKLIVEFKEVA